MKKLFFKKLFLFMALLCVLDFTLGAAIKALYDKSPTSFNTSRSSRAEIFVMGSSVAHNGYDPKIISKVLGLSVHNAARGGMYPDHTYGFMRLILKQHSPKLWVVVLTASLFTKFDRTARALAPCLSDDPAIKDLVFNTLKNPIEKYRYVSKLICFNQTIDQTFGRFIKPYTNVTGFEPLDGQLPKLNAQTVQEEFDIDKYQMGMLRKIVAAAREHGTEIVFAMAPRYYYNFSPQHKIPNIEKMIMAECQNLADELSVVLLDHTPSEIPEFYEASFYKDHGHLNRAGTKIISARLANDIKSLIDSKKIILRRSDHPKDSL